MAATLKGLRYSKEHEWVKVEGDKVRIGISDFAQEELGDIVFVELPEVGVNGDLDDNPEYVNESPYEKAWMVVIEPEDASEIENLMTAEQYEEMVNEE